MFSYFKEGIRDCKPCKKISIEALAKEIKKANPTINEIRNLDINAVDYKSKKNILKKNLPNITPNCTVSYRNDESIIEFSGYMYFDIDNLENAEDRKQELIKKYAAYISMICLSSSGRGLSILTKIENEITQSNFISIREYICKFIFKGLALDPKTKIKSNAWFISHDPHCYFNPCSVIEVPEEYIYSEEQINSKSANDNINNSPYDILPFAPSENKEKKKKKYTYKLINIGEVLDKLKFKTQVEVSNKVFDIKDVDFCEVYIPPNYRIPDGQKRSQFSIYIRNLFHLNPGIESDYIFSYINWINETKTVPGTKMAFNELVHLFGSIQKSILETGETKHTTTIKHKHFKENTISKFEKRKVTRKITDLLRISNSINKVQLAKQILEENRKGANDNINNSLYDILPIAPFKKVTQKDVFDFINEQAKLHDRKRISMRTIKTYWNYDVVDIEEIERVENDRLEITYIQIPKQESELRESNESLNSGVLDTQILVENKNEYNCQESEEVA